MCLVINVNKNCRKWYDEKLMQVFGGLDTLSFVRIRLLNWIDHVYRMDSKWKLSQIFNNNPQGNRLRGKPNKRWWNSEQTDINKCKIGNYKERSETGPLRRQSPQWPVVSSKKKKKKRKKKKKKKKRWRRYHQENLDVERRATLNWIWEK
jgi:hypothetical protein